MVQGLHVSAGVCRCMHVPLCLFVCVLFCLFVRPGPVEAARWRLDTSTECARSTPDFVQVDQDTGGGHSSIERSPVRRPRSSAGLRPNVKAPNRLKLSDSGPNIDRTFADARAIYTGDRFTSYATSKFAIGKSLN